MKHEYHCTWGEVDLFIEGSRWNVSMCGNVPKDVKKEIEKMEKKHPRPDSGTVSFVIRRILKSSLLYIK